jgi:hypothetical protein
MSHVAVDHRILWYKLKCHLDAYRQGYLRYHEEPEEGTFHTISNFYNEHIGSGESREAIWKMLRERKGSYMRKSLGANWQFLKAGGGFTAGSYISVECNDTISSSKFR